MLSRLFRRGPDASQIAAENRLLKARLSRLETEVTRRRTDDILATRDNLIPLPAPGSSSAKLLTRNRALQQRVHKLLGERATVIQELVDAATEARGAGLPELAKSLRQRAAALVDGALATEHVDTGGIRDHLRTIDATWSSLLRQDAVDHFWTRLTALATAPVGKPPPGLVLIAEGVVAALVNQGPARAADELRVVAGDVSAEWFAIGGEAVLFALASTMGTAWTDSVRAAWCTGIEAVAACSDLSGRVSLGVENSGEITGD